VEAHSTSAKYRIDQIIGVVSKDIQTPLHVALVYDYLFICSMKTDHVEEAMKNQIPNQILLKCLEYPRWIEVESHPLVPHQRACLEIRGTTPSTIFVETIKEW
jgi:hypothetical protein